ncbi:type IV pilus assembly protein PilM [Nocardioides sp. SR21]|uniref:type IV pilus assembly protein PilM n=1 Tax=Nocardioides sp. SR21 TaxID=2919501 RepID=UPI001FAA2558|nr:type IV pilus assembly protein PilM [Nocardioides sp. SR21]
MPRTLVGLDIGSSGVRAAEFAPGRRRSTLRRYAEVALAPGVVRTGGVVDGDALTEALRTLWSRGKFRTKNVTLGIANAGVLVRQLDLDWMPPADFRKALRYQVQDVLPISVDEANLDYHQLEELELPAENGTTRRVSRILLVAASRDMVDGFVDAAHRAGLQARGVDLLPFALVRARAPMTRAAETEAIVDIGADVVSLVVHAGGTPRYVRMIPGIGGDTITAAVQERYDWSWEDAERTKRYVGLPGHAHLDPLQQSVVGQRSDGLDHAAQQVVVAAANALADEIATTLDFYRDSNPDAAGQDGVARLVLTGSGALLGGFDELLAARVGVPVETFDVTSRVKVPGRIGLTGDGLVALAVPAGLCVGAAK